MVRYVEKARQDSPRYGNKRLGVLALLPRLAGIASPWYGIGYGRR